MAEEHRAFRTEPEGDDIAVVVFEPTDKAQHVTGKGQQMGPGNAGSGPGGNGVTTIPGPSVEVWHLVRVSVTGVGAQALLATGEGSGWPAKCAFRLARIIAVAAVRDSGARPATCGVTTTLSHCSSSGSMGGMLGSPRGHPGPPLQCAAIAARRSGPGYPRPSRARR